MIITLIECTQESQMIMSFIILLMMLHMEGKYLCKGARKTNGNVNTFKTSDKQAINMIAGAQASCFESVDSVHAPAQENNFSSFPY